MASQAFCAVKNTQQTNLYHKRPVTLVFTSQMVWRQPLKNWPQV